MTRDPSKVLDLIHFGDESTVVADACKSIDAVNSIPPGSLGSLQDAERSQRVVSKSLTLLEIVADAWLDVLDKHAPDLDATPDQEQVQ